MTALSNAERTYGNLEVLHEPAVITEEAIRRQLLEVRSKYCEPILELLAEAGELYHGDLADKLKISPSGLNAIIKKMQAGSLPIVETIQVGKYKIYTLSDEVKDYIQKKNVAKVDRTVRENETCKDLFVCLQHFVDSAGKEWREQLNVLLQGKGTELGVNVKADFRELIESVVVAADENEKEYEEFKTLLGNEILVFLLNRYLDERAECDRILWEIEQQGNGKRMREILKTML